MIDMRIGQGFDVHRYDSDRPLILCGEHLEGEVGLEGHSDADVALHAVCDALFGAIGEGDIGLHFPPSNPAFKDMASRIFVEEAMAQVASYGLQIVNLDLTLIGEQPRLTPYRDRLREALAALLVIDVEQVNVKATTTEGLGFPGRREGLAAMVVVLLAAMGS